MLLAGSDSRTGAVLEARTSSTSSARSAETVSSPGPGRTGVVIGLTLAGSSRLPAFTPAVTVVVMASPSPRTGAPSRDLGTDVRCPKAGLVQQLLALAMAEEPVGGCRSPAVAR